MKRLLLLLAISSSTMLGAETVTLGTASGGRIFEGFGTLSAGASSKLLIDYLEPQRSEVLDHADVHLIPTFCTPNS